MSERMIQVQPNGPILVKGPLKYTDPQGQDQTLDKPFVALCRCGSSSDKPFCDGTHSGAGFEAEACGFDRA